MGMGMGMKRRDMLHMYELISDDKEKKPLRRDRQGSFPFFVPLPGSMYVCMGDQGHQ